MGPLGLRTRATQLDFLIIFINSCIVYVFYFCKLFGNITKFYNPPLFTSLAAFAKS